MLTSVEAQIIELHLRLARRTILSLLCGLGNRWYPAVLANSINLVSFQNRSELGGQANDRAI
jgi:hypothetical protein